MPMSAPAADLCQVVLFRETEINELEQLADY